MKGYCQNCKKMVDVSGPATVQLPNHSFIHRGVCPDCAGTIFVKIHDHELLIDEVGRQCPKEVYLGLKTPKKIFEEVHGQVVISKEGVLNTAPMLGREVKTVYDVKAKIEKERKP